MGYTRDAVAGISWTGLLSFFTKAIGFVEVIVFARILAPSQFGAYSIALLSLGLLEVISETGINIVLLQEKEINKFINSAWVISIIRGIIIMAILILSAPFISSFFHSDDSLALLYAASAVPLLRGFINPSVISFQKDLKFKINFWFRLSILIVDTFVSIAVVYFTKNPLGIIIGLISGVITEVILSFIIIKPRPKINFERKYLNIIFHRGKWITATSLFDYLFHNIDNVVVGRLLGPASLGVYQIAYSLAVMPLSEIGRVVEKVSSPIFVKISGDKTRLRYAIIKVGFLIFSIAFPFAVLLVFFPGLVVSLLGNKWVDLPAILPILAGVGMLRAFVSLSSSLFISVNKLKYITYTAFISILVLSILIIPLVSKYGVVGAGFSALIATAFSMIILTFYIYRTFKLQTS